jgi:predicted peptidase
MKLYFNLFAKLTLLLAMFVSSAQALKAQLSKDYKNYQQSRHRGMRYGLFKPDHYDPKISYPMIVYLHGSTDTASRELTWYKEIVQKENPCFVLSPKTTEPNQGWGNTWENKHTPAMEHTLSLLDSLVAQYNIDKNRLYIYGISMGGFGVFSVLAKEPGKFAGAYAVCGGSNINAASKIITPLWIFHGAEDDVVPVRLSKNMFDEMVSKGNKTVRYTEYETVKHNSWENVGNEKTLAKWLLSQEKGKTRNALGVGQNLTAKKLFNSTVQLQWRKPAGHIDGDEVWYYKIFRDNAFIGEVDGDVSEFNDYKYNSNSTHAYYITAVN